MTYEKYNKTRLKEGQKLLYEEEPCLFEGYDECYGRIIIRFDVPIKVCKPVYSYASNLVYTKVVGYEEIEIQGKIK